MTKVRSLVSASAVVILGLLAGVHCGDVQMESTVGCDMATEAPDAGVEEEDRICEHDLLNGPEAAGELEPGEVLNVVETFGYVCPMEDRDWYRVTVPEGDHLVNVELGVHGPLSPVQPTFGIYACDPACVASEPEDGTSTCCAIRSAPTAAEVALATSSGEPLRVTHCVEPGEYYLMVRDQGDDGQDGRDPRGLYHLTYSTAPDRDAAEPNDGPESAVGLASAGSRTWTADAQISCRGDQDWYVLDETTGVVVGPRDLLQVTLDVPVTIYQPQVRIVGPDSLVVATASNQRRGEATALDGLYWLGATGRYYVVVEDDDGGEADPRTDYRLTVRLVADEDPNEPNNGTTTATDLGGFATGGSWDRATATGTIAATNDVDVYRVGLGDGSANGVLDVEVAFGDDRPEGLQPSVRVVRPHLGTPCEVDSDCRALDIECDPEDLAGYACSGYGNSCLAEGRCAGASVCLAGGVCGANVIERHPDSCGGEGTCHGPSGLLRERECASDADCAPQGSVHTAIPIGRGPDTTVDDVDELFVVVQDFASDTYSPTASYTLTVETRADPDASEPNERYTHLLTEDTEIERLRDLPTVSWGGCIEGAISYERDRDVFMLEGHPCPTSTEGCTLRFTYDVGEGPVEFVTESRQWDNFARIDIDADSDHNEARSGSWGGSAECIPANSRTPDRIAVTVRDLDYVRDFSADQHYRICFYVHSQSCSAPCAISEWTSECYFPE